MENNVFENISAEVSVVVIGREAVSALPASRAHIASAHNAITYLFMAASPFVRRMISGIIIPHILRQFKRKGLNAMATARGRVLAHPL